MVAEREARRTRSGASWALATAALVLGVAACLSELDDVIPAIEAGAQPAALPPTLFCGDGLVNNSEDGGDAGESCDPGDAGDAGVPGCKTCQIECPNGVLDDAGRHCYFTLGTANGFIAAHKACSSAEYRAHVVTIASARESAFAAALVDGGGFWLGLSINNQFSGYTADTDDPVEPGYPENPGEFCTGCFSLGTDGGPFAQLSDAGASTGSPCVVSVDGGWYGVDCNDAGQPFTTICEREPIGRPGYSCGGWCTTVAATAGTKAYRIGFDKVTAEEARAACAASAGSRLVVLETREEREQVARELFKAFPTVSKGEPVTAWVGLQYDDAGATWTWGDSGVSPPLPWSALQPSGTGDKVAFLFLSPPDPLSYDTALLQSDDGNAPLALRYYICERPPGQ